MKANRKGKETLTVEALYKIDAYQIQPQSNQTIKHSQSGSVTPLRSEVYFVIFGFLSPTRKQIRKVIYG